MLTVNSLRYTVLGLGAFAALISSCQMGNSSTKKESGLATLLELKSQPTATTLETVIPEIESVSYGMSYTGGRLSTPKDLAYVAGERDKPPKREAAATDPSIWADPAAVAEILGIPSITNNATSTSTFAQGLQEYNATKEKSKGADNNQGAFPFEEPFWPLTIPKNERWNQDVYLSNRGLSHEVYSDALYRYDIHTANNFLTHNPDDIGIYDPGKRIALKALARWGKDLLWERDDVSLVKLAKETDQAVGDAADWFNPLHFLPFGDTKTNPRIGTDRYGARFRKTWKSHNGAGSWELGVLIEVSGDEELIFPYLRGNF